MTLIQSLSAMIPEIILASTSLFMLVIGAFQSPADHKSGKALNLISTLALITLLVTAAFTASNMSLRQVAFNGMFVSDYFSTVIKFIVLLASALTLYMSRGYLKTIHVLRYEFAVLICLSVLGMMIMVSANHFLVLYLGLELFSLATYVLVAIKREDSLPSEAGLKYFVLGAVASGFILYGLSLIYGFTGSASYETVALIISRDEIASHMNAETLGLIVGMVFLLAGLAFKISAAPFHMWTPDVYQGAPTIVTAFLSMVPKLAVIAMIVRILVGAMGDMTDQWQQIIIILSMLSMFVGAFGALMQTNIKRLLGYSTIGHVGYALLGLAAATEQGVSALLIYLVIYMAMSAGVFAIIMTLREKGTMKVLITDMQGYARHYPFMGFCLAVLLFSMAGIPPFAGFFGKFFVVKAVIDANLVWLGVFAVLTSVVAAYYYIRIIVMIYMKDPVGDIDNPPPNELQMTAALTTAAILLFILMPDYLIVYALKTSQSLFLG